MLGKGRGVVGVVEVVSLVGKYFGLVCKMDWKGGLDLRPNDGRTLAMDITLQEMYILCSLIL